MRGRLADGGSSLKQLQSQWDTLSRTGSSKLNSDGTRERGVVGAEAGGSKLLWLCSPPASLPLLPSCLRSNSTGQRS